MVRKCNHRAWRRLKDAYRPYVEAGVVRCRRCGAYIRPGQPWDLGHAADVALGGAELTAEAAPEHARCNRAAGGVLGSAGRERAAGRPVPVGAAVRLPPSRQW